jgi:CheY-like chemotaxis protein
MTKPGELLIFVVDDERVIATTLVAILRNSGFRAECFIDPLEALRAAEAGCPDLVISDVVMPQMTGIELGVQIRARFPNCRVLLFSGQAVTEDLLKDAHTKGHDFDILAKPVHPTDLLNAIRSTSPAEPEGHGDTA